MTDKLRIIPPDDNYDHDLDDPEFYHYDEELDDDWDVEYEEDEDDEQV